MAAVLVTVAAAVLKPVLEKLAVLAGEKYKRFKNVHKEIPSLSAELKAMEAFLLEMSKEEDLDEQDKLWMNEVRDLSYDIEDSIDDFMKHIDDIGVKPDDFMGKIKHLLTKSGKINSRRQIGSDIHGLNKKFIQVSLRNERYKARRTTSNTINSTVKQDPRAYFMIAEASRLVGIDEPKAKLIKLLGEQDGCVPTQPQPKVLSIAGPGGMGKTTIAYQLYEELKGRFKCKAFVSVSRTPNRIEILRSILSEVTGQDNVSTHFGEQQLIFKITSFLVNQSYFIVFDDIWKKEIWNVIRSVLPVTSHGIVIITTRLDDVANEYQSFPGGQVYNIKPLDGAHSRQLFHRRIFTDGKACPLHLQSISDQILEKCDGLPLAIISIAGLLATKESTDTEWNYVKEDMFRALAKDDGVAAMMKILSLSFYDLDTHLKTCLLYLSIFPEDHLIESDDLIRRWIGEGFIHKQGEKTAHEAGQSCFNELVNRSLIQPWKKDKCGKVQTCRLHDATLDLIRTKSMEENFVALYGVPHLTNGTTFKVRRLSIQVGMQGSSTLETDLSHVRSLSVFRYPGRIPSMDEFRHIRVLDFRYCKQIGNDHLASIEGLFQLRYLNLRGTGVNKLPHKISLIKSLEVLDLRDTKVCELPENFVFLKNLVDLLIDKSVKFAGGIATMRALEILDQVGVFNQKLQFLQDLGQLEKLRKLHLHFQDDSAATTEDTKKVCMEAIETSLYRLGTSTHNLRSLTLSYDGCSLLEKKWYPLPHLLQKLDYNWSPIKQVPEWVGSLKNLKQLNLQLEGVGQKDLRIIGSLPILLALDLQATAESKQRLKVSGETGFPCLKSFTYIMVCAGMELMFAAGSMPRLEKIHFGFHAAFTEYALQTSGGSFDFGIKNLPCLTSVVCNAFGRQIEIVEISKAAMEKAERAMERAVSTHPNRPTISFTKIMPPFYKEEEGPSAQSEASTS